MTRPTAPQILACALIAAGTLTAGAALWPSLASLARLSLFASGFAGILMGMVGLLVDQLRTARVVRAWLDELERRLGDRVSSSDFVPLAEPSGAPNWLSTLARLQSAAGENLNRMQNAEHVRTALEVRLRRAQTQEQRLQAVLGALSEPVLAVDAHDELVLANPAAAALFELPELRGERQPLDRLVRCEALVALLADPRHWRGNRREKELEVADDGQPRWFQATATQMIAPARTGDGRRGETGELLGAMVVLRDATTQRDAGKRHAEFVSAVSHEMKTPLASIKAYVELLADGEAEDEATRENFLEVINSQAERLQRLIDNLLNLARIEAGVVRVQKQPRPINALLEEAVHLLSPAAEQKRIQLSAEFSPMYLGVLADRDLLLQAAINLLSNAIKYTSEGGRVGLRSRLDGEQIVFEVCDTGVGLSEEDRGRVFEKFYRVRKNSDMAPGTGLGLSLVKHIVEDVHGGKIEVESVLGEGSTFRVLLPSSETMHAASVTNREYALAGEETS